jgi:transcriptional regulator with XRE-family HTH domain
MKLTTKPRLLSILKERGLTQTQLSDMSGVPQGSISRFDRNESHVDWHVFAIAKALDVKVEDLFEVTYPSSLPNT